MPEIFQAPVSPISFEAVIRHDWFGRMVMGLASEGYLVQVVSPGLNARITLSGHGVIFRNLTVAAVYAIWFDVLTEVNS